jgi:hypothetical protein
MIPERNRKDPREEDLIGQGRKRAEAHEKEYS